MLVPRGAGRLAQVFFLCVWLVAWAVGEAFALGALFDPRQAPAEAGFLGPWLALWTLGGAGAINQVLVQLFGREVVSWSAEGVTVRRRLGRNVHVPREAIDHVLLTGKDAALAVRASTDSDRDTWFELVAFSAGDERVLVRAMDDVDPAVALGRRLAAETGAPLSFAPEVEALVGPVEALPPVVSDSVDALTTDRGPGKRSRS